jgi:NADH-quinone oxidoreductase subunit F
MPEFDLAPLQSLLKEYSPQGRTALLPVLHAAQAIYGYLPEPVAMEVSRGLKVPLADVYGVIEFYALFHSEPVGKTVIHICNDIACSMAGSDELYQRMIGYVGRDQGGADRKLSVERVACLGLCEHAPAILIQDKQRGHVSVDQNTPLTEEIGEEPRGMIRGDLSLLTSNCGKGRSTHLSEYEAGGGYQALRKVLQMPAQAVIEEVKASGLVGRGGAAFPTGLKLEGAAEAKGEIKSVICNGDEAEPGTFKDRVIMEEDPHRVIEGLMINAYAIGAQKGFIFVRGESPRAFNAMSAAVAEAHQAGYWGENILRSGFHFEIEMRKGAGAYICGEETALFEAIEGRRGFPRVKPPFPTTAGLFGKPTVINNVETLCNIPLIMMHGAKWYRQIGTEKSPGPKLFCVSGDITYPGLYEVPFGITIHHLINDLGGGVRAGHELKAVLIGGAAGAFATAKDLDVRLSFEDLRNAGLPLGSGVVTVIDETRDLRDILLRLARFFANESCGKCYPCQLGTQRQVEILERVASGNVQPGDRDRLNDVGWTMTDASLCGLGQTAASAVISAMHLWPDLFTGNYHG